MNADMTDLDSISESLRQSLRKEGALMERERVKALAETLMIDSPIDLSGAGWNLALRALQRRLKENRP